MMGEITRDSGMVHRYGEIPGNDEENISVAPPSPSLITPNDILVSRSFAFLDLSDFSEFSVSAGPPAAFAVLREFRSLIRIVASTRGVRIASWLGDGAMLVGVDTQPTAATVCEIVARSSYPARGSVTFGQCLLFEGDDHIGGCVNLSARLCSAANAGQVLTTKSVVVGGLPSWIEAHDLGAMQIRGLGEETVCELGISEKFSSSLRFEFPVTGSVPAVTI